MRKVVINGKYGGFGISRTAVLRMRELGSNEANCIRLDTSGGSYDSYDGWGEHYRQGLTRHDPILVQVVEELGSAANGTCAGLKVMKLEDDDKYLIEEHDGLETLRISNEWK